MSSQRVSLKKAHRKTPSLVSYEMSSRTCSHFVTPTYKCLGFSESELDDLRKALPMIDVSSETKIQTNKIDICDISQWTDPTEIRQDQGIPREPLDWHGAPRLHKDVSLPRNFRSRVRLGEHKDPTNGVCPGFLQCNLVVLPQGPVAFDFLLFCQRNPKACPLVEVCDVGSPFPHGVAPGADLRTDLPK